MSTHGTRAGRLGRIRISFIVILLLMSPEHFGVLAYDHFSAPDNGCRILTGIVKGHVEFPTLEELE